MKLQRLEILNKVRDGELKPEIADEQLLELLRFNDDNLTLYKFEGPFRVGRKQNRVVLDNYGLVVVEFPVGCENMADDYCKWLNNR